MVDVKGVLDKVDSCARACGRAGEVLLMAVSKTHPYEAVMEAYAQGQRLFGENRVQEIAAKFPPPGQRPDGMTLCLIGHLQRNKVRKVIPLVDRIDSVDSIPLMDAIEHDLASTGRTMDVLFEINSSGEAQKSGFVDEASLMEAVAHLAHCPHIHLAGLMTVGPLGGDVERITSAFRYTRGLFDRLNRMGLGLEVLSMGMSADYEIAIREGSSEVRIGTAIFGMRSYDA